MEDTREGGVYVAPEAMLGREWSEGIALQTPT